MNESLIVKPDDIRLAIFKQIIDKKFTAVIRVKSRQAVLAGMERAVNKAIELGFEVINAMPSGSLVRKNDEILRIRGNPLQIALAEDLLIGVISKASGVATAAKKATEISQGRTKVVCGAWKKMPFEIKDLLREALLIGGVGIRISDKAFIYLDKNYVRMFGGIKQALDAVKHIKEREKVVQIRGEFKNIDKEAVEAVIYGADIVFIDTGDINDLKIVNEVLKEKDLRESVRIAFGGNVKIKKIPLIADAGADIIDIGRDIIDAPLIDMSLDVEAQ
ncbi:MAG: nicotinate-nucleotide pyrophosphorylase [Candidatus Geothermarchaeota archaeon]